MTCRHAKLAQQLRVFWWDDLHEGQLLKDGIAHAVYLQQHAAAVDATPIPHITDHISFSDNESEQPDLLTTMKTTLSNQERY